jgi:hypothetical protein
VTSTAPPRPVDYWTDSRRPLASLLFVAPLLVTYELGILLLGAEHLAELRNGADTWMRGWLLQVGLDRPWALPVLIVTVLVGWQIAARFPWRISTETLVGMGAESLLGAILLLVVGQILSLTFGHFGWTPAEPVDASLSGSATAISFLGAGIYEEVLFRLLLLPITYFLLRLVLVPRKVSALAALLVTSSIFALAHYLVPDRGGLPLSPHSFAEAANRVVDAPGLWFGFGFRWLAGLVFAVMFMVRGFGITVGSHVFYDLLVGIVLAER